MRIELSEWVVLESCKDFEDVRGHQHNDGIIDIFGVNYPASAKRDIRETYLGSLTPTQFKKVQEKVKALVAEKQQKLKEKEAKRIAEKQAKNAWLKKAISELRLPEGFSVSDDGQIFDYVGNYIFSLPKEPVDDINNWFKKEWKEFLAYCE